MDLAGDRDLHPLVTTRAPIREAMLAAPTLREGSARAPELAALTDGLGFDRLAGGGAEDRHRIDAEAVLAAYLTGIPRRKN